MSFPSSPSLILHISLESRRKTPVTPLASRHPLPAPSVRVNFFRLLAVSEAAFLRPNAEPGDVGEYCLRCPSERDQRRRTESRRLSGFQKATPDRHEEVSHGFTEVLWSPSQTKTRVGHTRLVPTRRPWKASFPARRGVSGSLPFFGSKT